MLGLCIIRREESYKVPLDDGVGYPGDFNDVGLPTGNTAKTADNTDDGGDDAAGGAEEGNE